MRNVLGGMAAGFGLRGNRDSNCCVLRAEIASSRVGLPSDFYNCGDSIRVGSEDIRVSVCERVGGGRRSEDRGYLASL